jgi:hypothetical protein
MSDLAEKGKLALAISKMSTDEISKESSEQVIFLLQNKIRKKCTLATREETTN